MGLEKRFSKSGFSKRVKIVKLNVEKKEEVYQGGQRRI